MSENETNFKPLPPSPAFVGASWLVVGVGIITYSAWLWNSAIIMDVKYFYWVSLMLALFAAVSISKTVRDKEEGVPVTGMYFGLAWIAVGVALGTFGWVLWNTEAMSGSEKGFLAMAYLLSMFAAVAVQKNTRDSEAVKRWEDAQRRKGSGAVPKNGVAGAVPPPPVSGVPPVGQFPPPSVSGQPPVN